ncbi:hypothetical protein HPP92_001351 [Vanilla planifolia]|uniref:Molybdate-anion transporter n=1 Tax=Vanilla planifolia TaxID=51239 RepID=A0A835VHW6_VANPL|nr:hypothetical protein HPP92_001351 [Vanilla planifolia]
MGVVIEREEWELNPLVYVFLFACCFLSVFLFPHVSRSGVTVGASTTASSLFDLGPSTTFLRFQRRFLLVYSIASAMEGLQSAYGEFEFGYNGMTKEQIVSAALAGTVIAFFLGTSAGILSDIIGPRKICICYCFLHLLVGVAKSVTRQPGLLLSRMGTGLASSVFSFCFESWMVNEHEKHGHRVDLLSDTFWLMTLFESSCFIGSQGLGNLLIKNPQKGFLSPASPAVIFAMICILYMWKEWNADCQKFTVSSYRQSFTGKIFSDKRVWMLGWAQASVQFSVSVFWILWAPTIVADGREVQLSHIYPCFLGSRMLGSTAFPWLTSAASPLHNEDHNLLTAALAVAGLVLSIVAYDYQDIAVLMALFCIFHSCIGLILPCLANLRTKYVPNELRGGMISASLVPAHIAFLLILLLGAYYRSLSNASILASAAAGLLSAAGCVRVLRLWGKYHRQNQREL